MKRKLCSLAILILIFILLVACGNKKEANSTDVEAEYKEKTYAQIENDEIEDDEIVNAEIEDGKIEDDEIEDEEIEEEDYKEEDFPYINIDWFDLDDDRYPPAHLKGFDTMQSAVEYYEDFDYVPEWSVLWVVVPRIDADGTDENNNIVHDTVEMTQDEIDFYSNEMSNMFEEEVEELSLLHVNIVQDVLVYDKPIICLDYDNDVSPECFDEETREKFREYNSVICCVKLSDGENQKYNCG